jgi:hypothetical protein
MTKLPRRWSSRLTELARQAEGEHQLACSTAWQSIEHVIRCGEVLAEAKAEIPHGQWLAYIADNLSFGPRQAQKYIRLAAHRDELAIRLLNSHS